MYGEAKMSDGASGLAFQATNTQLMKGAIGGRGEACEENVGFGCWGGGELKRQSHRSCCETQDQRGCADWVRETKQVGVCFNCCFVMCLVDVRLQFQKR